MEKFMILRLDDRYAITSDQHSWAIAEQIQRTRRGHTVTEWQPILWYPSLEKACSGFVQLSLRVSDAESLAEALAEAEQAAAKLCAALQPQFEVKARPVANTADCADASATHGFAKAEKSLGGVTPFGRWRKRRGGPWRSCAYESRRGNPMSAAPRLELVNSIEWGGDLLIDPGRYRLKFEFCETRMIFGHAKIALRFTIADFGQFFGTPMTRWYNARRLIGRASRNGNFALSGKRSDLFIEHCELFDMRIPRLDRVPMSAFNNTYILAEVETVTKRHDQRSLPEQAQYSIVRRLLKVVPP